MEVSATYLFFKAVKIREGSNYSVFLRGNVKSVGVFLFDVWGLLFFYV